MSWAYVHLSVFSLQGFLDLQLGASILWFEKVGRIMERESEELQSMGFKA